MYGKAEGFKAVEEYIKNHRYVGAEITARELVSPDSSARVKR